MSAGDIEGWGKSMKQEHTTEHCEKCGSVVYGFSKSFAVSNGESYCTKCAEELDRTYLEGNTCSVCTRLIDRTEVKFVMPSRLYSSYFFDRLPMAKRLMCTGCYRKVEKLNIISNPLTKIGVLRMKVRRIIVRNVAIKSKSV